MTRKILFVGPEAAELHKTQAALHNEPYAVESVGSTQDAFAYLSRGRYSVVVATETIGAERGADFLAEVQRHHPTSIRLMVTENAEASALIDAVNQAEIYRFLSPPLVPGKMARVLRDALNLARVAEAQEAVWNAAKQQKQALQHLVSRNVSSDEADMAVPAARFAGLLKEGPETKESVGQLPEEQARRLSARENEIVQALAAGRRVKEIAQDLVISTHTVRNHLKAIYRKLNVRSQFELISLMARHSRQN